MRDNLVTGGKESSLVFYIATLVLVAIAIVNSGCSRKVVPPKTLVLQPKAYDTTLYNLSYMEGVRQKMLGNAGEAVKYFEQALQINSGSDASAFEISIILFLRGDVENAKRYGKMAVELDSQNTWYLNSLANIYFSTNSSDSAIMLLEKIVAIDPGEEEVLFNLAGLYLENGRAEKAETIFSGFREKYGSNQQIIFALINAKNAQKKYDESEKMLVEMIDAEPDDITYPGMLAEQYRKLGMTGKAEGVYNDLFAREPDNPLLILSYIDFLLEAGKYDELANRLNSFILNDSIMKEDKFGIMLNISNNTTFVKDYSDILVLSALVLEANYPDDIQAGRITADIYGKTGNIEKEIEKLEELVQKDPGNYPLWEQLLIKVNESGNNRLLYEIAKKASTTFNIYPLPKLMLAFAATDSGEYKLALDELAKVRILINEQREYMVQILSLEADIFYRQKKYDEAFARFEQALAINPDDAMILNNYAYFLSEQDKSLKRAETMIVRALEIDRNETYLDTYAWVLYKSGKYRQAEGIMKEIFSKEISDPELLEHYGFIMASLGNCDEAVKYWQSALGADSTKKYLVEKIMECTGKK